MKNFLYCLIFIFLFGINAYSAVELDADANGAVDLDKGGTNVQTIAAQKTALSIPTDTETELDGKEPLKGADDNYVTDAEKIIIGNTSGINTGDQVGDGVTITGVGTVGDPFVAVTGGSGDVSKVGTPVNDQVGVWTGDGTIEGTTSFTFNGSVLQLVGSLGSTGTRVTKGWFTDLEVTNNIVGGITGNAGTVTNGVYTTNNLSVLSATTSAELASVISNETGTELLVYSNSPVLVAPDLGTPSAIDLTNATNLPSDPIETSTVTGATIAIDFADSNDHTVIIDQNTAITISNFGTAGTREWVSIRTEQDGDYTVTVGGESVTLTASGNDMIIAYTDDGGTTVNAAVADSDIQ